MEIELNKIYYFNNRPVLVLREESVDFVFVAAGLKLDHNITGSNFCTPCNSAGYYHTCEDAQNVIDHVMDDIEDKEVFWIAKRYLKEHPFEYKENIQLKEANSKLKEEREGLKQVLIDLSVEKKNIGLEIAELDLQRACLSKTIENNILVIEEQQEEIKNLKQSIAGKVNIKNTSITISADKMLELLKSNITLRYLEQGGVDNWEWYGENFPEDMEEEAFKEFKNL